MTSSSSSCPTNWEWLSADSGEPLVSRGKPYVQRVKLLCNCYEIRESDWYMRLGSAKIDNSVHVNQIRSILQRLQSSFLRGARSQCDSPSWKHSATMTTVAMVSSGIVAPGTPIPRTLPREYRYPVIFKHPVQLRAVTVVERPPAGTSA